MNTRLSPLIGLMVLTLTFSGCGKAAATQPPAPQAVIATWNMSPPPNGLVPSVSRELELPKYTQERQVVYGEIGSLPEGQWIDVVVTSIGVPALFGSGDAGFVGVYFQMDDQDYGPGDIKQMASLSPAVASAGGMPTYGKFLYLPEGYRTTDVGGKTKYTTAYRLFIPRSTHYRLVLVNHNPSTIASVTYEVFRVAMTPGWAGDKYYDDLENYLAQFPSEKQFEAMARWMAQFG